MADYTHQAGVPWIRRISSDPGDEPPRWGSDSKTLVFIRREGALYYLYRASLDSLGVVRKILNQPVTEGGADVHLD